MALSIKKGYLFVVKLCQTDFNLVPQEVSVLFLAPIDEKLAELNLEVDCVGDSGHNVQNASKKLGGL